MYYLQTITRTSYFQKLNPTFSKQCLFQRKALISNTKCNPIHPFLKFLSQYFKGTNDVNQLISLLQRLQDSFTSYVTAQQLNRLASQNLCHNLILQPCNFFKLWLYNTTHISSQCFAGNDASLLTRRMKDCTSRPYSPITNRQAK